MGRLIDSLDYEFERNKIMIQPHFQKIEENLFASISLESHLQLFLIAKKSPVPLNKKKLSNFYIFMYGSVHINTNKLISCYGKSEKI